MATTSCAPKSSRLYSALTVKAVDEERRLITGTASTPQPDRAGDIIEPLGISFKNPVPLLLYHNPTAPVGRVKFKKPTEDGLDFEATLPVIPEPGTLRDRVEEAWQSIKANLIGGVSIGFRSIEEAFNKETSGFRFLKTEVLELSLVSIPANPDALIATIKAMDLAVSGRNPSAVAEPPAKVPTMTTSEQITQFENSRAAKAARMADLMAAAAAAGATLDQTQSEEYDATEGDVKAIDAHLVRLRAHEQLNKAAAVPVTGATDPASATAVRGGTPVISVKANVPKGTAFIRYCTALAATRGNKLEAIEWAKRWKDSTPEVELVLKAAIAAGTSLDATWAGPLAALQPLATEFLEYLRPATVIDRIPNLRRVPFNVSVPAQTGGGTYAWVGQGAPKAVSKLAFSATSLAIAKAAGIIVITVELAKVSTPSAEAIIRADMVAGMAQFLDVWFTDPTKAAVTDVNPASITNGVTPITSAGTSPANARTDILALASALTAAGMSIKGATLLMSETNALALAAANNALGQSLFPEMNTTGGNAVGINVIASQALGANVILLDGNSILYADDGGVEIDVSTEASVQMDSAPDNPALATTVFTSFWQNNLIGLRCDRFINWKKARTGCVQYTVQTYVAS